MQSRTRWIVISTVAAVFAATIAGCAMRQHAEDPVSPAATADAGTEAMDADAGVVQQMPIPSPPSPATIGGTPPPAEGAAVDGGTGVQQ